MAGAAPAQGHAAAQAVAADNARKRKASGAHVADVAHDRLAALGWVVGFRRGVATVAETPGKEGVVNELVDVSGVQ